MSKQYLTQVIEAILNDDMDAATVASSKYFESKAQSVMSGMVGSNPKGNDVALAGQSSVPNALGKDKFKLAKKPLKLKKGKYGVDATPQAGTTPGAVASGGGGCAGGPGA